MIKYNPKKTDERDSRLFDVHSKNLEVKSVPNDLLKRLGEIHEFERESEKNAGSIIVGDSND